MDTAIMTSLRQALPPELLLEVMRQMEVPDLRKSLSVSRGWRTLAEPVAYSRFELPLSGAWPAYLKVEQGPCSEAMARLQRSSTRGELAPTYSRSTPAELLGHTYLDVLAHHTKELVLQTPPFQWERTSTNRNPWNTNPVPLEVLDDEALCRRRLEYLANSIIPRLTRLRSLQIKQQDREPVNVAWSIFPRLPLNEINLFLCSLVGNGKLSRLQLDLQRWSTKTTTSFRTQCPCRMIARLMTSVDHLTIRIEQLCPIAFQAYKDIATAAQICGRSVAGPKELVINLSTAEEQDPEGVRPILAQDCASRTDNSFPDGWGDARVRELCAKAHECVPFMPRIKRLRLVYYLLWRDLMLSYDAVEDLEYNITSRKWDQEGEPYCIGTSFGEGLGFDPKASSREPGQARLSAVPRLH